MPKKAEVEAEVAAEAEAKRQRKLAKKAAKEAAAAEPEEVAVEVDEAEAKRQRKAAKKAAREAAAAEAAEAEIVEEAKEETLVIEKKAKKAKRAEEKEAAEPELLETPKKQKRENRAEAKDAEEAPKTKKSKTEEGAVAKGEEDEGKEAPRNEDSEFRVFVAGFNYSCTEEQLRKFFGQCGEIAEFKLPAGRTAGESKGIAFITFADQQGFDSALKHHGTDYEGRSLKVTKANSYGDDFKTFISGIPCSCTEGDVRAYFEKCGKITELKLIEDRETGKFRGIAFVSFSDKTSFIKALKCNDEELEGSRLKVDKAVGVNAKIRSKEGKNGKGKGKGKSNGKEARGSGKGNGKNSTSSLVQSMTK